MNESVITCSFTSHSSFNCYSLASGCSLLAIGIFGIILNLSNAHIFYKISRDKESYRMLTNASVCLVFLSLLAASRSLAFFKTWPVTLHNPIPLIYQDVSSFYFVYFYLIFAHAFFYSSVFYVLLYYLVLYEGITKRKLLPFSTKFLHSRRLSVALFLLLLLLNSETAITYQRFSEACALEGEQVIVYRIALSPKRSSFYLYSIIKNLFFISFLTVGLYPIYLLKKHFQNEILPITQIKVDNLHPQRSGMLKARLRSKQIIFYFLTIFLFMDAILTMYTLFQLFFFKNIKKVCSSSLYVILFYAYFVNYFLIFVFCDGNVRRAYYLLLLRIKKALILT